MKLLHPRMLLLIAALSAVGHRGLEADEVGREQRLAEAIVAAFNDPDPAEREARLDAVFGERERNAKLATALGFLASRHGQVAVEEIADSGPTFATLVLAGEQEGDYLTLNLAFENAGSDTPLSVSFRPGRPAPATPTIDRIVLGSLLEEVAHLLRSAYVLREQRERLADAVAAWEVERFADIDSNIRLAETLTRELRELQDDRHLAVLDPVTADGRWEDSSHSPNDGQPEHGGPVPEKRSTGADYGLARAELRDGNIGYLEVAGFDGSPPALERLAALMPRFRDVDAMVIDLRGCPGGEPAMVRALSSYFFAEPTLLAVSEAPWTSGPEERWTEPVTEAGRLPTVPLYLLTSSLTASAAESFAFGLRRNGRATLVGETTAGAGHLADLRRLPGDFGLQLPIGRTYDPDTGLGWEGNGLDPDHPSTPEAALELALELATGS